MPWSEDFDVTSRSSRVSKSSVAGEKVGVQCLRQRNICCVVDGEVVAQLPAAAKQRLMRRARQWRRRKVGKGKLRATRFGRANSDLPTQDRGNLDVEQFGSRELFAAKPGPRLIAVGSVIGKGHYQDTGVNDEHDQTAGPLLLPSTEPTRRPGHPLGRGSHPVSAG